MEFAGEEDFEIIIAGSTHPFAQWQNIIMLENVREAEQGKLALLRNICYNNSSGSIVVFLDDDVLLASSWYNRLTTYSLTNNWDILGNRILLPNGERYWDRAITKPHQMVPYNFDEDDKRLYQTGCFWIVKKTVLEKHLWDAGIMYYAEKTGGINEDVDFSQRLIAAGYKLKFDALNTVWHWDERYQQVDYNSGISICIKTPRESTSDYQYSAEFLNLIKDL